MGRSLRGPDSVRRSASITSRTVPGTRNGRDVRAEAEERARRVLPSMFGIRDADAHDLQGIVAKPANGRYHSDGSDTNWIRIKNPRYTQVTARH